MSYFQGEQMTCIMCGVIKRSHPRKESGWTVLENMYGTFYICDLCFPGVHSEVPQEVYNEKMQAITEKILMITNRKTL